MRLIDADALIQEVKNSMNANTYGDPQTMLNRISEHINFLHLIETAPEINPTGTKPANTCYCWTRIGNNVFYFPF